MRVDCIAWDTVANVPFCNCYILQDSNIDFKGTVQGTFEGTGNLKRFAI